MWVPNVRDVLSNMVMVLGVIATIGIPFFKLIGSRVQLHIEQCCDQFVKDFVKGQNAFMQLVLTIFVVPIILIPILPVFVIDASIIHLRSLDSLCLAVVIGCVHYAGFKHFTWWHDAMVGIGSTCVLTCLFAQLKRKFSSS